MKNLIIALLLSLPAYAFATCTTANDGPVTTVTCTTGTESTLTASSNEGHKLNTIFSGQRQPGLTVHAETAGTMTAGGTLQAYVQNPATGNWNRVIDLDLTVAALARQAWFGLTVANQMGRIIWLPNGTGLATTIYITAN
jgi:hypothetical protein